MSDLGVRGDWLGSGSLGDQLWHQAMIVDRRQTLVHRDRVSTQDEKILMYLIERGVVDHSAFDQKNAAATRAMRHSAAMADRLWAMLDREKEKVRLLYGLCYPSIDQLLRPVAWKGVSKPSRVGSKNTNPTWRTSSSPWLNGTRPSTGSSRLRLRG